MTQYVLIVRTKAAQEYISNPFPDVHELADAQELATKLATALESGEAIVFDAGERLWIIPSDDIIDLSIAPLVSNEPTAEDYEELAAEALAEANRIRGVDIDADVINDAVLAADD